jgi:hypothetical protein
MYVPRHMLFSECNSILRNYSLAGRCMRRNKDRVAQFKMVDRLFLESVEFEGILRARQRGRNENKLENTPTLRAGFGTSV